jgi:hypothetical protein
MGGRSMQTSPLIFRDYLRKLVADGESFDVYFGDDTKWHQCPKSFKINIVAEDYIEWVDQFGRVEIMPFSAITRVIVNKETY